MKAIGIIPARYASTRFPGKPLVVIQGKTMIHRVYEQASKCSSLGSVVVATDDERIYKEVESFGGNVVMTAEHHKNGTERCVEALQKKNKANWDVIVNIQGDEPFIYPEQIDKVVACFKNKEVQIATLAMALENEKDLHNPSIIKVVRKQNGEALYFSRSPIPFARDAKGADWTDKHGYLKHIGLYAFRTDIIEKLVALPPSSLELAESLEQLRWLENGYPIYVDLTKQESISIDTPEDLKKLPPSP
ncbi:MAG TPA: 3-deoxy-manno-octulosonate cytidylyltransferase [Bacteroidia bacterium]|nr:3-deoxy-manno-octulosonate cytidylyltransferase [Bacteroidia bacterium]